MTVFLLLKFESGATYIEKTPKQLFLTPKWRVQERFKPIF